MHWTEGAVSARGGLVVLEKRNISSLSCNWTIPCQLQHSLVTVPTAVLAVSLIAKGRNNVHAVELEVLQLLWRVAQTKHQLQVEKYNLETLFKDVFTGMIPCSWRQCKPLTYKELLSNNTASHQRRLEYLATSLWKLPIPQELPVCNTVVSATNKQRHLHSPFAIQHFNSPTCEARPKPRGCNIPLPSTRIHSGTRFMLVSRNLENASTKAGASRKPRNPTIEINSNRLQCYM